MTTKRPDAVMPELDRWGNFLCWAEVTTGAECVDEAPMDCALADNNSAERPGKVAVAVLTDVSSDGGKSEEGAAVAA